MAKVYKIAFTIDLIVIVLAIGLFIYYQPEQPGESVEQSFEEHAPLKTIEYSLNKQKRVVCNSEGIRFFFTIKGDTLSKISASLNIDEDKLAAWNGIINRDDLQPGRFLRLDPQKNSKPPKLPDFPELLARNYK